MTATDFAADDGLSAVRGFFDAHLKQKSTSPLNLLSPSYSELEPLDIQ
jgi:hypothetical protein